MNRLSAKYPFTLQNENDNLRDKILNAKFSFSGPEWSDVSDGAKDLVRRLIVANPEGRMNVEQALKHKWFTGFKAEEPVIVDAASEAATAHTVAESGESVNPSPTQSEQQKDEQGEQDGAEQSAENKDDDDEVYSSPVTYVYVSDEDDSNIVSQSQKLESSAAAPSSVDEPDSPPRDQRIKPIIQSSPSKPLIRRTPVKKKPLRTKRANAAAAASAVVQEPSAKVARTETPITHFFPPQQD